MLIKRNAASKQFYCLVLDIIKYSWFEKLWFSHTVFCISVVSNLSCITICIVGDCSAHIIFLCSLGQLGQRWFCWDWWWFQASMLSPDSSKYCLRAGLYRLGKSWCMQKLTPCPYFCNIAAFLGRGDGLMWEDWKPYLWLSVAVTIFVLLTKEVLMVSVYFTPPCPWAVWGCWGDEGGSQQLLPTERTFTSPSFWTMLFLPLILLTSSAGGVCDSDPGPKHGVVHDCHIYLLVICVLIMIPS